MYRLVKRDRRRERVTLTRLGGILLGCLLILAGSLIAMGWRGMTHSLTSLATPVAGDEASYAVTWRVQMKSAPPKGDLVGVVEDEWVNKQVEKNYLEAFNWLYESLEVDLSETERYFKDASWKSRDGSITYATDIVAGVRQGLTEQQEMAVVPVWELGERHLQVMNFSPEGSQVYLVDRQVGGGRRHWIDRESGEVMKEDPIPPQVQIHLMVYDTSDGRWKIAYAETIELPPGAETDEAFYEKVWKGVIQ